MLEQSATIEQIKNSIEKLKKDLKQTRKSGMRKYHMVPELIAQEHVFVFMKKRNEYIFNRIKKEKERAWQKLNDEEFAKKYGWYSKKQSDQQIQKWAEEAFPQYNLDVWEIEYDIDFLIKELQNV